VVFVTVVRGISSCEQLAVAVRSGPLTTELVFPYHPHVTVAHDLDEGLLDKAFEELADFECEFEVDHFELYVHDTHLGWQPTRAFSLTGPPGRR
jgi:2'-5' RNA ligase